MFRVKYPVGVRIKNVLQGALKVIDEVPMSVTSENFIIRALSPDKNLLVEIKIPQTAFELFEVSGDNLITLEKVSFMRAFKRATKRDSVLIEFDDASKTLKVTLINIKTGVERSYQVEVRGVGIELVGSIDVELPVSFQIPSKDFIKIIRDAKLIDEDLELICVKDRIEVMSRAENKMFKQVLELDKPLYTLNTKEEHISSKYDLDILKAITRSLSVADMVTVELGSALPLKISFDVGDGSTVTYWVAPKV